MSDDEQKDRFGLAFPLCAAIVAGGTLGGLGVQPFPVLAQGARATMTLITEKTKARPDILGPNIYPGEGVVKRRAEAVAPGNTLIEGIFPGGTQVRLYDANGTELHRWSADFFKVWPDAKDVFGNIHRPKSQNHYFIQGIWPSRDGSVVINFGELGAVRLDACSNVLWRTDRRTHHSVTPTGDGKFWIPGQISPYETPARYLATGMTPQAIEAMLGDSLSKGYNNSVLLVNKEGKVEKEFSVLKAIYDAGLEHAIYSSLQEIPADPTHVNDVEIVTDALAARIGPQVNAGDLLVSVREMSMLAVLDKDDGHLKWHEQGPWVRQHDIDIAADGLIEIFNNRSKTIGKSVDSSQIVSFDPASGKTQVLFPTGKQDRFFTYIMGTHQKLENGNRLIAETQAGRVFEVTPAGEVVWDFRMPYDDKAASLLTNAMRIPVDYFEKEALSCPQQS